MYVTSLIFFKILDGIFSQKNVFIDIEIHCISLTIFYNFFREIYVALGKIARRLYILCNWVWIYGWEFFMKFRHRGILPPILSTTPGDTINFSGNGNPRYRRSLYNPNPYLEAYFFWRGLESNRSETKRRWRFRGGGGSSRCNCPKNSARKKFSIRAASLSRGSIFWSNREK